MPSLLGVSLVARLAIAADVMALTMYVVLGLDLSYAAAGGVTAALTAGLALGGPVLGRMIDRHGLRAVVLATVAMQGVFWLSIPVLPYALLLGAAFLAGVLMVPVQLVNKLGIAALTTANQRQAAFSLDAVQGELSYLLGPSVVVLCAAQTSPHAVAWGVGAAIVAGGVGLLLLNPPLRADGEVDASAHQRPPRRTWLGIGMTAVLTMVLGTTTLLAGVDLAIVATLEAAGQVSWAAVVIAVFGVASVAGGLIYGTLPRPMPSWLLLGLLGLVTIPAGLAHDWRWLCLAAVGAGLLTAPTLSTLADAVSRLAPASVRGEATGVQSAAHSAGLALGSLIGGLAIDVSGPGGGFATVGLAGLVAASTGYLLARRASRRSSRWARRSVEEHRNATPLVTPQRNQDVVRTGTRT
jgi:MFS family permease